MTTMQTCLGLPHAMRRQQGSCSLHASSQAPDIVDQMLWDQMCQQPSPTQSCWPSSAPMPRSRAVVIPPPFGSGCATEPCETGPLARRSRRSASICKRTRACASVVGSLVAALLRAASFWLRFRRSLASSIRRTYITFCRCETAEPGRAFQKDDVQQG